MDWLPRSFRDALAWFQGQQPEPVVRPEMGLGVAKLARQALEESASAARREARAADSADQVGASYRLADDLDEAAIEITYAIEEAGV
jgi:hypothetical protein